MNRAFLMSVCLLFSVGFESKAQQLSQISKEREVSNLEKFTAKSGTLIEKIFVPIGSVSRTKVEALIITDLMTSAKITGVKFEYEASTRLGTSTKNAFLDNDEVEGLIKSINILKSKVFPSAK